MRRAWRGLALVLLLGALAAAPWAAGGAVQNLRDMLQKPAPEWEGVLTVGGRALLPDGEPGRLARRAEPRL